VELVVAVVDDVIAGLRYLVPGAGEVAERLDTTSRVCSGSSWKVGSSGYSWRRVCSLVL